MAFTGHGQVGSADRGLGGFGDFYLLPYDCPDPDRPDSDTAWLLGQGLRELLRRHDRLDGLVVLVDACHSGHGAVEVAHLVSSVAAAAQARFEVVAATDDRTAADGCFTWSLTALMRQGHTRAGERLWCTDVQALIRCRGQVPQRVGYDGRHLTAEDLTPIRACGWRRMCSNDRVGYLSWALRGLRWWSS